MATYKFEQFNVEITNTIASGSKITITASVVNLNITQA